MNSFIQRILSPFRTRWSKTRSTLEARGGEAGKRALGALQDLRDSDTGKRAVGKINDLRESDTGKRAASALANLRQRDPVRKAEEAARRTLHGLSSGSGSGGASTS